MRRHWKTLWFAIWLLSQALAFALPISSSLADWQMPPVLAGEQSQGGNHGYDSGFRWCRGYDAELPSVTTLGFGDVVTKEMATSFYDPAPIPAFRVVGLSRAPPVGEFGFLAANTGTRTSYLGKTYYDTLETVWNGAFDVAGIVTVPEICDRTFLVNSLNLGLFRGISIVRMFMTGSVKNKHQDLHCSPSPA